MPLLWVKGWCKAVVPNLWYAAERLRVRENNIGNGGKHQKKKKGGGFKLKKQKKIY
jgi:hypothetical protein